MEGICGSSSVVRARRMRLFACPRNPRRIKLWRERIAFTICGTTVSSYPTMPGNIGPPSRSRAIRFSRSSSLTRRVPNRCSVKGLRRNSPRVRGKFMVGTPKIENRYADYTAVWFAALLDTDSDERCVEKDTLPRTGKTEQDDQKLRQPESQEERGKRRIYKANQFHRAFAARRRPGNTASRYPTTASRRFASDKVASRLCLKS